MWIRRKAAVTMSDRKVLFRRNGEKAVCGRGRNEGYVLKNAERGVQNEWGLLCACKAFLPDTP